MSLQDIEGGWRRVTEHEVRADLQGVRDCLDVHGQWAIYLIEGGKVMGSSYGYNIAMGDEGGAGSALMVPGTYKCPYKQCV